MFFINLHSSFLQPRYLNSHYFKGSVGFRHEMHRHPVYHIILIEKGEGRFFIKDQNYKIRKRDLVLISPDEKHQFTPDSSNPYEYLQVTFDLLDQQQRPTFYNFAELFKKLNGGNSKNIYYLKSGDSKKLRDVMKKFIPFGETPQYDRRFESGTELLIFELLMKISELLCFSTYKVNAEKQEQLIPEIVTRVRNYLKEHYKEKVNLHQLSRDLAISPFHLSRRYKELSGQTIFESLLEIRIEIASNLLKHSFLSIKEIASQTGFQDVYYFSKCFKKKFGIPPRAYARSLESDDHVKEE